MAAKSKFEFLKSVRFWKLFVVGGLVSLQMQGFIDDNALKAIATLVEIWLGGSVVVGTVDRAAENLGS